MSVPTTRTKERASVSIDYGRCSSCRQCVAVCKDFTLIWKEGKVMVSDNPAFGCIACGHCMAICPENAVTVNGRTLSESDLFEIPSAEESASFESLYNLLKRRRSVREFKNIEIEEDKINKIIEASSTSPMGIPPSDVNLLIIKGKNKNREFAEDFCSMLDKMKWLVSWWFLALMRPFWGKSNDELFRGFIKPMINLFTARMREGENLVTYDAPLAIYFYASQYADPADPIIAATTAMYAAESLGLSTCMIGSVHPLIQQGALASKFREKYKIKGKSREGLIVLFGYPAVKYKKGVKRSFCSETTIN